MINHINLELFENKFTEKWLLYFEKGRHENKDYAFFIPHVMDLYNNILE